MHSSVSFLLVSITLCLIHSATLGSPAYLESVISPDTSTLITSLTTLIPASQTLVTTGFSSGGIWKQLVATRV